MLEGHRRACFVWMALFVAYVIKGSVYTAASENADLN